MRKFILFLLAVGVIFPIAVNAQFGKAAMTALDTVAKPTNLTPSFEGAISPIISGALSILGTIFLILMVYAGILWMTAQGNDEKVTKAKDIVTAAIIGLAITLGAYAITAFVTGKLAGGGSSGITPGGPSDGQSLPGASTKVCESITEVCTKTETMCTNINMGGKVIQGKTCPTEKPFCCDVQ